MAADLTVDSRIIFTLRFGYVPLILMSALLSYT